MYEYLSFCSLRSQGAVTVPAKRLALMEGLHYAKGWIAGRDTQYGDFYYFFLHETERKSMQSLFLGPSHLSSQYKQKPTKTAYHICCYYYYPWPVKGGTGFVQQGYLFYFLCLLFPVKSSLQLHFSEEHVDCFYHCYFSPYYFRFFLFS